MSVIKAFVSSFVNSHGGNIAICPPLNYVQATTLSTNMALDVREMLYSGVLSIADACNGIRAGYPSWATVKLYYSVFYSLRAILLIRGRGVFHLDSKPGLIEVWPGGLVRKLTTAEAKGGSHGQVLYLFNKLYPNSSFLTPIGTEKAIYWLKHRREEVNYGQQKFVEPSMPYWFTNSLSKNPLRSLVSAYSNSPLLYAFDPDHATLALPLLISSSAISEAKSAGMEIEGGDRTFLASMMKDHDGPLANLIQYLDLT